MNKSFSRGADYFITLRPCGVYMHHKPRPSLVQTMACRLEGAKSLSKFLIGIQTFSFKKMHLKMSSAKWRPFCLGPNVLNALAFHESHVIISRLHRITLWLMTLTYIQRLCRRVHRIFYPYQYINVSIMAKTSMAGYKFLYTGCRYIYRSVPGYLSDF